MKARCSIPIADEAPPQEFARDVLDNVVEGPESDAIWETFQGEESEERDEDGPDADEEELAMQMEVPADENE